MQELQLRCSMEKYYFEYRLEHPGQPEGWRALFAQGSVNPPQCSSIASAVWAKMLAISFFEAKKTRRMNPFFNVPSSHREHEGFLRPIVEIVRGQ